MDRGEDGPAPVREAAGVEGRAIPAPSQIGEALWRARLRMGLSLNEVASRTGTTVETVSALEDSAFDRLPGRDKTIALARSYARLVRVPEKWVVATLACELAVRLVATFPLN